MSDHRKFGRQNNVRAESRMLYERLEDRVLFDAVPDGPVDSDQLSGSGADAGDVDRFDTSASAVDVKNVSDSSLFPQNQATASDSVRHELVIIDESVDDFQSLVDDLQREDTDGTNVQVVTIDAAKDGVEQINAILSKYSDLDAIQIVSHGSSTGLNLGNVFLTADNLAGYAADVSAWGHALNSSGDLLLLGCELASSAEGRDLLQSLQTLTGADVAASVDDTGYSARGGDWDLEYILGQTETTIAFSESVQSSWQHLLAPGPSVSITTQDTNALIGEDVQFQLRFDNTAVIGSGDVGYGPFIDLLFPANGADGQGGTDTADGLTFQNATYLGQAVNALELTFIDIDGTPGDNGTVGDPADDTGASTLGYLIHPYLTEVQNELQILTFSGQIDGGTLGLSLGGESTTLDLTATGGVLDAATLQTALESLSTVGAGNVVVTGSSLPGDGLKVEFVGALAQTNVSDLVVDNSLLELGGSTIDPHGAFAVSSITNGSSLPQGSRVWGTPGDKLVILELPFGSITPDQPELDIVVNATVSQLADAYTAGDPNSELNVRARAGFRFGTDELNNPDVDPPIVSDIQNTASDWVETASIRPTLLKVTTDIYADENETATGPNYPRTFDIRVAIPEGQTIEDLDITDLLPDNIVFLTLDSITSPDATTTFTTNVPSGNNSQGNNTNQTTYLGTNGYTELDVSGAQAGQSLIVTADQITGTGANDIVIRFKAYVDEFHADSSGTATSSVIDLDGELGAGDSVSHTAFAVGDWEATDTRDQGGSTTDNAVSASHTSSIVTRPLAIQKDVSIVGSSNSHYVSPGDILRYEISFQISDYFSIDDLLLSDTFSDGQLFYDAYDVGAGTDYRPTLTVSDGSGTYVDQLFNVHVGGTNSATTESAADNFIVDQSDIDLTDDATETGTGTYTDGSIDPTTGTTTITIDLAERLRQLGDDGILQGGHTADGDANDTNTGAATGRIVFYTLAQQDYTDTFPSGDRSVDHDDTITNNASVTADVVENAEDTLDGNTGAVLGSVTDTSATKIDVEAGVLTKTIYAVNGDTNLPDDLRLQPGDSITYRLTYTLPNSDFERLTLTDYLPLPALVVDDFNADEVGGDQWSFDSDGTFDATVGAVELGPNDTFFHSNPGSSDYFSESNIIVDTDANSLQLNFGSYDDDSSPSTQIDLLFTMQIQDDPFADGLYLTNIARVQFGATNQTTEPADALVKIELGQPVVGITKGIVATDDASVVLDPVGPSVNNEFQTLAYTGGTGAETFTLTLGGSTTSDLLVTSSAATIQTALTLLPSIGAGNVIVTGTSVSAGDIAITFVGSLEGTDVAELVVGTTDASGIVPAVISTELDGGDAIVIGGVGSTIPFTGRITSSALADQAIDLNLDDPTDGLEAGDTVRFMIVVENTGTGTNGAFDVQLRDQLPAEFEYVSGSLSVVDGVGDAISFTTVGTHPEHALFGSGIVLDDPGSTPAVSGGTDAGALDSYSDFDGRNIAIITYDAKLVDEVAFENDNVTYRETIENQAVLVSYAGREGSEDHTPFRNEIQRLATSGTATGGTYQLTFEGETTAAIAWNASDLDVIAALESLSTIGSGNVVVTGAGISSSPMTIQFQGDLSDQNVSLVTADASSLTGTSSIATTTLQQGSYNEQQALQPTGSISGGTFTLTFEGETTAAIAWDADAAAIQAALEALNAIPAGSVMVEGGTFADGAMNLEFTGSLTQRDVADLIVDATSLAGGTLAVTTVQQGATMDPQDAASIVIRNGSLEKGIVSTSEDHTSTITSAGDIINTATVGEIVRYQLKVELPGGTHSNLQILDQLPTGLAFIDDGTAVLSFISDTAGSIVSVIGAGVLPDAAVSTSATSNHDNYESGTDVWFSLGDVVNTEADTNAEYVVVEFNAIVVNESGVAAGDTLTNTASVYVAGQSVFDLIPTVEQQVRIVEPQISTPAKTVKLGSGSYGETVTADAGDVVDYRVTFNNANTSNSSDAFDVVVLDELPEDITLDVSTIEVYIDGVLQAAGSGYTDLSDAATDTIEISIARLNTGQSVEVRYSGTLQIAVSPNETLTNTVDVSYTSLPGEFGTTGNVTGSDLSSLNALDTNALGTDDAAGIEYETDSGDKYGERNGQNDGTSPNTYFVQDTANVYVAGAKSISKILDSTSIDDSATDGNNLKDEAVIGEIATYTITVKLNEGTMPNAEIIDTMDTGLVFVGVTGISTTGLTLDAGVDLNNPTVDLAGRRVTWDLGTIVDSTPGDVSTVGDSDGEITITYQAVVTNHADNDAGETRDNNVQFRYDDDPSTAPDPRHAISATPAGVKIIEPAITVNKTVALDTDNDGAFDDGKTGDAGDKVQYTITLQNNSGVDAFDIDFSDAFPKVGTASAILAPTWSVSDNSTTGTVSASDFELVGSDATGWTLQLKSGVDIDLLASQENASGDSRTITFTIEGTIATTVTPNLSVNNSASVEWESINGDYTGPSSYTTNDTERTGADGATGLNNYIATDSDAFVVSTPDFTKHLIGTDQTETSGSNVTIGEIVTYGLYVSLPEGITPDLTIVDVLPPGLQYVSSSFVTTVAGSADAAGNDLLSGDFSGTIATPTISGGTSAGDDVTFTFGQIDVDVNNVDSDNGFLIIVSARIVDVATNHGYAGNQTVLANSGTLDISTDGKPVQTVASPVNVTVVEPSLEITKEFGPTVNTDLADAGETVTVNLTVSNADGKSTAYDVSVTDTLNPLHYDLSSVNLGTSGTDYPADFTVNFNSTTGQLTYSGGDIAEGGTVTFKVTVTLLETVTPNQTLLNTATVTDASTLDGTVAGERNNPDPDGDGSDVDTDTIRIRRNSLAGYVWDDANNDGVKDASESGIGNVDVRLTGTDHLGNTISIDVQTNADGSYLFDNLRAGTYSILQDPDSDSIPTGYLDGKDTIGTPGGDSSVNDRFANLSLPTGTETHGANNNFGEIQDADLSGIVYHDANNNNAFDGSETGINGVQIRLTGTDDRNQSVSVTVTTAGGGLYSFTGLRPSNASGYTITQLTEPTGYLDGKDSDGSLGNGDATSVNNAISSINVVPGASGTSYRFGELLPSTLSGYVYHDSDNDGARTDEAAGSGIAGSQITLTGKDDLGATVSQTATTNASGYFEFTNLRPSDSDGYTLTQTSVPATYIDGKDTVGSSGGNDAANNVFSQVVVVSNTTGTENNFGELLPSSLSGTVFNDHDNDGVFETGDGETPIAGVTIRLTGIDDLGNAVDVTLQTGSDGTYEFSNLRPSGTDGYTITQTQPSNYNDGKESDGSLSNGIATTNDVLSSINVSSGDTGTGYSFAEQGSTISGVVYVDDDRDGSLDSSETTRLGGVSIELFDLSDPANPVSMGTTTTATDGTYSFQDLPAGQYRVVQTQPDRYGNVSSNTINLTLPLAGLTGNNFGEALYDIGDTIYFDADGNGSQSATEQGIAGVTVSLTYAGADNVFGTADDPAAATTTTNAAGEYEFTELFVGNYRVTVTATDLPDGVTGTQETDDAAFGLPIINGQALVAISAGDRFDVDFGYKGSGVIGSFVWVDVDGDGLQDAGEPGLADITVNLTFAGKDGIFGNADDLTLNTSTAADGTYSFANLPAGDFQVAVDGADTDLPGGLNAVSGAESISGTASVSLTTGENNNDIDFGFAGSRTVGNQLWLDTDGNQSLNGNEQGLPDVGITLIWLGQDGVVGGSDDFTLTTSTDSNGQYSFSGLPDGNYQVSYAASDLPANVVQTYEQDGTLNNQTDFTVNGSSRTDIDFGVRGSRSVGNTVWYDADGNGSQSGIEPGLAGIEVVLTFAGNDGDFSTTDDNFSLSTTTDANGNYNFASLPDGEYQLSVQTGDLPTGMTTITAETDDSAAAHDGVSRISVNADRTDVNFGFKGTGVVGDSIFYDENGDGVQDGSEVGIPGVTVQVEVDYTGDGITDFTTTAVTDQDGKYSFTNLPEGSVTVSVTNPTGTNPTTDHDGDSTADSSNQVNLPAGTTDNSSDFGFIGSGTIGNTVYFDADGDGAQDDGTGTNPAEPGLPNVDVFLDIDFNKDGIVDRTLQTVTAADGSYQFANLPAGDYTVRVTQPTGTSPTGDADGIAGASANQSSLSLASGQSNTSQNFGYKGTGSITDTVFFDIDNDATNEVGTDDRGIEGVDVTLSIDVDGDGTTDYTETVQTDVNGDFTFTNLIPGQYTITTDSTDMRAGLAANPTVDNDGISTPHSAEYSVTAGTETTGPGFGFHATPDYDITKTGSFTVAKPGDTVQYTIVVKNIGELDGRNVVITDTFPKDVLQITGTDGGTLDASTGTITWDIAALNPNQQQIFTVTAVVENPVADGLHDFTNSVSVTDDLYNGIDPDKTNNTSSWKAELDAEPDYAITKTNGVGVDSLAPGDRTTYTITVTNNGDQDGTGVVVTDRFPVDVLAVFDADSGIVDTVNGTITWNVGDLAAGETVILRPTFDVIDPAVAGIENFTNHADVKDDGKNGTDPTPGNNTTSDTDTLVAVPDYKITKWIPGSPASVFTGETVTYSILVENIGDQGGTGVIVTDTYPTDALKDVTAVGATIDPVNGTITWNLGDLGGGGESVLLTVTATVRNDLPAGLHDLVNEAKVTDDLSNGTDPDPSNNVDTDVTFITGTPDLTIQKTDSDAEDVRPGETVWYTITYSNQGDQDATGVVITETTPEGSVFDPAESTAGWVDQGDGTWTFDVGSLPTSTGGSITFAVTVNEELDPNREELMNTVSIKDDGSNGPDSNPTDNVATDTTPLQVYTFDSFQDFSGNENDQAQYNGVSVDRIQNRLAPLPIDTVYTGVVDPGTTLTGKIYDEHGRMIGEQTVVADCAGNWLMQFPTVVLSETPHQMQIQQTLSVQNDSFEAGFNLRRFFHPAVHSQVFMTSQMNVGEAFFHSPSNVLEAMHEANNNPLAFGWMSHPYELVISSTNVASM